MTDHNPSAEQELADTTETDRRTRRAVLIGGTAAAAGTVLPGHAAASDSIGTVIFYDGSEYVSRVEGGSRIRVGAHVSNTGWFSSDRVSVSFYADGEHIGSDYANISARDGTILGTNYQVEPVDQFTVIDFTVSGPHDSARRTLEVIP